MGAVTFVTGGGTGFMTMLSAKLHTGAAGPLLIALG
jgi:hypothetical protein